MIILGCIAAKKNPGVQEGKRVCKCMLATPSPTLKNTSPKTTRKSKWISEKPASKQGTA